MKSQPNNYSCEHFWLPSTWSKLQIQKATNLAIESLIAVFILTIRKCLLIKTYFHYFYIQRILFFFMLIKSVFKVVFHLFYILKWFRNLMIPENLFDGKKNYLAILHFKNSKYQRFLKNGVPLFQLSIFRIQTMSVLFNLHCYDKLYPAGLLSDKRSS